MEVGVNQDHHDPVCDPDLKIVVDSLQKEQGAFMAYKEGRANYLRKIKESMNPVIKRRMGVKMRIIMLQSMVKQTEAKL